MSTLLAEAWRLLDETPDGTVSAWPRAAALLARQQLEGTLRLLWQRHAPGVERASMRAQLACLPHYLGDDRLAGDIAFTWNALSRATHHHPYELDPTRDELASLLTTVEQLSAAVAKRLASTVPTIETSTENAEVARRQSAVYAPTAEVVAVDREAGRRSGR